MKYYFFEPIKFFWGSFVLIKTIDRTAFSFKKVNELEAMAPSFNPNIDYKISRWYNYDYILIFKYNYIDKLLENKNNQLTYMFHPFCDKEVVRYIVGFPGEWVKHKKNNVYHKVPKGHCWVECLNGDEDSNYWGPVPISLLIGKPVLKIRPFQKIVRGKKIENNMKKKLKINERVKNDKDINTFFI